ncbi:hypothetical protein RJ639_010564 [Escallonia herrerae]|uniref:Chromo domain-containing protein n=1 Tax=Escallonia herrerae TaxID=1293975 RepID=A0AA88VR49_9ASTE|nr:hypothetical protein RJ639_010564 [Escallonia herrerae]
MYSSLHPFPFQSADPFRLEDVHFVRFFQECHPVAYESRKLNEAERRYTTHEKELLVVVHCLRVWRHCLLGSSFIVRTDNTAVSHFLSQSKLSSKQDRADSRVAINIGKKIRMALTRDPVAQQLLKLIESGKTRQFWQEEGLLMTKGRRDKVERKKKAWLLQPLQVPKRPWESVSLDFITGLPKVGDLGTILVVVDRFSKYASFIATPKYCSAEDTAQLFFKYVVKYWGMPQDIVRKSPRAISFSEEWRQNIDLAHSYLEKAARRMKKHADKNMRSQEFNVGDKVMVKLLSQDLKFLRGRDSRLLQKCEGPLTIVKKIGKMAYKVDPPHWWSRQLHPVFHVNMLKPFYEDKADPSRGQIRRQGLKPKVARKRVAEAILNDRVITASRKRHQEYLVKWQGHMDEENTWERAANLSAYADKIEAHHTQKLTRVYNSSRGECHGLPLAPA